MTPHGTDRGHGSGYGRHDGGYDGRYDRGHAIGYASGHAAGYEDGHTAGHEDGRRPDPGHGRADAARNAAADRAAAPRAARVRRGTAPSGTARVRRGAALLAAATALVALAGCGLPGLDRSDSGAAEETSVAPKAPVPSGKPLDKDAKVPEPGPVDDRDATAVAQAWATAAYSYDTAYDAGPHDAVLRAGRYCTEKLAAADRSHRPAAGSGPEWAAWAEHRAWTRVKLEVESDGDAPADTATTAWRQLAVTGTAKGRDGWEGDGPRLHAFVELRRGGEGEPWRVNQVNVVEAAGPPSPAPGASTATGTPTEPTE
ncbi:hypothetical protein [Streptomyces lycii]|uniref:Lipoprotein n=1 Tax=Streptomyces lycii TaxID=2654337 RepID=A0ABQ7FRL1_9ACTN|nr:hypothetical protein [Streptomyces lycii]KAF4410152.1 hypothetical protein GCU69_05430 [Streptomyces lycii]